MKVLMETITNRRGYKNFADEAELNDFLAHNHNKITGYFQRLERCLLEEWMTIEMLVTRLQSL